MRSFFSIIHSFNFNNCCFISVIHRSLFKEKRKERGKQQRWDIRPKLIAYQSHTDPSGLKTLGRSLRARLSCSRLSGGRCWGTSCRRCHTSGRRRHTRTGCATLRLSPGLSRTAARYRRTGGRCCASRTLYLPRPHTPRSSRRRPLPGRSNTRAVGQDTERWHTPVGRFVFLLAGLYGLQRTQA